MSGTAGTGHLLNHHAACLIHPQHHPPTNDIRLLACVKACNAQPRPSPAVRTSCTLVSPRLLLHFAALLLLPLPRTPSIREAMALGTAGKFALVLTFPGVLAFILGIVAENKKPTGDLARKVISNSGLTTCLYPKDPTPALGSLAAIFLFISAVIAVVSLIYPYEGKSISLKNLAKSKGLVTFVVLSVILFIVAEALLLWATVLESVHRKHNHHGTVAGSCPTAKAGLFGGASFMALDSTLFWLICLMLAVNARADHFGYEEEDVKGNYEDVTSADFGPALGVHITPKV